MKTKTIKQKVVFAVSPAVVYETLLDSKKHSFATGAPARVSAKVGGKFSAWDGYITGKNLELVENKKIVQEWTASDFPPGAPASKATFKLIARGAKTELQFTHEGVPAENAAGLTKGWREFYWDPMKKYFAGLKK